LGQPVLGEAVVAAVVAVVIKPALLHVGGFGVGVDVAQGIERPSRIGRRKASAVVAFFPKVAAAVEQAVKAHGGIPVKPVHDLG
jgi:hypothetical protein